MSDSNNPAINNDSLVSRRALKACASCRHDKTKCDGSRPCGNCAKKGYAADQCVDGCEPCRKARVRCENGKPCRRCIETQQECYEDSVSSTAYAPRESTLMPIRTTTTTAGERVKLACQSCRRDNKKCDEQRPCARCVARKEDCVSVGRGPKLVKLRCEGCRDNNKKCDDTRPCEACVEAGRECLSVERKGRGHGTRVKTACTNCRRDKIRCDGVRPCNRCVMRNTQCLEPACKSCNRNGRAQECTHRPGFENSHPPPSPSTSIPLASPSSSSALPLLPPPPPALPHQSSSALPPPPHPHPSFYTPYYYPPPYPHQHPHHPYPGPPPMMSLAPDPRYYPIIDPSIDERRTSVSSERATQSHQRGPQ